MQTGKTISLIGSMCIVSALSGCATSVKDVRDPYEDWNRSVQSFNDKVDDYALKPVAKGYQYITPSFVDRGITNFFSNINDIGVTLNDFMQLKFEQGAQDGARFLVNSVAGVGGFIDVAEKIDLPKHDEDFDQTLAVWGIPSGPYLVLPLLGPSTPRGVGGLVGDAAMNPIAYIDNGIITGALAALQKIDLRADNLSTGEIATEAAIDRYDFFKNSYLQRRNFLINDGNVPEESIEFDESDFEAEPSVNQP